MFSKQGKIWFYSLQNSECFENLKFLQCVIWAHRKGSPTYTALILFISNSKIQSNSFSFKCDSFHLVENFWRIIVKIRYVFLHLLILTFLNPSFFSLKLPDFGKLRWSTLKQSRRIKIANIYIYNKYQYCFLLKII